MILTCPACATQYTVKDGAIPPGGRQVRCASCKHSWHQDSEAPAENAMPGTAIAPPPPHSDGGEAPLAEPPEEQVAEGLIAQEPTPEQAPAGEEPPSDSHSEVLDAYAPPSEALEAPHDEPAEYPADDGFAAIPSMHDEEGEPRRGRSIRLMIFIVLLVIVAAAAFWFLAPADLKARVGLAEAGESPLELMLTTSDRQRLASGNELLAISGRIINPTDREQLVPPIRAELRNKVSKKLVYRWTIAAPARSLPPRGTASFNSAEVDIPEGGDELTVTLGGSPG